MWKGKWAEERERERKRDFMVFLARTRILLGSLGRRLLVLLNLLPRQRFLWI